MLGARDWDKFQDWARLLLGAIKGMGSSDERPGFSGNVALNLGVCPCAVPMPNLEAPVVAVSKAVSNLVRSVRTADIYTFIFQQVTVKCKSYRDVMSRCGQTPHS